MEWHHQRLNSRLPLQLVTIAMIDQRFSERNRYLPRNNTIHHMYTFYALRYQIVINIRLLK